MRVASGARRKNDIPCFPLTVTTTPFRLRVLVPTNGRGELKNEVLSTKGMLYDANMCTCVLKKTDHQDQETRAREKPVFGPLWNAIAAAANLNCCKKSH
jgi:tRNA G26 N,N-dimethylase Trm1